jgi:IS30 family transposase
LTLAASAHLVASKLRPEWSPEQIAGWLKRTSPDDETYPLEKELMTHLRRTRGMRRSRHHTQKTSIHGRINSAVSISERPAAVEERAVPGHWEGDLFFGSDTETTLSPSTPKSYLTNSTNR